VPGVHPVAEREGRARPPQPARPAVSGVVVEFRPRFAVFENVPGIRRTEHGRAYYHALLAGFRGLDYAVTEYLVDAADYGVPQHRERAIVIAARNGEAPPRLRPSHGDPGSPAVRAGAREPWRTVRDAIATLSPLSPGERHAGVPNHVAPRTGLRRDGGRLRDFLTRVPPDGGSRSDVPREYWVPCHLEHDGHSDVYGRLAWGYPANTITTGCTNPSKGPLHAPGAAPRTNVPGGRGIAEFPAGVRVPRRMRSRANRQRRSAAFGPRDRVGPPNCTGRPGTARPAARRCSRVDPAGGTGQPTGFDGRRSGSGRVGTRLRLATCVRRIRHRLTAPAGPQRGGRAVRLPILNTGLPRRDYEAAWLSPERALR